uniref:Zinc finger protein SNAI2 n=1 Tax=Denticeps clupeoides TaxID=299321 RepID=A0AAY4B696_9TELE
MPRSFLVKKHFNSAKKPNYSELESPAPGTPCSPRLRRKVPAFMPPSLSSIAAWTAGALPLSPVSLSSSSSSSSSSCKELSGSDDDERTAAEPADAHGGPDRFRCALCAKSYSTYSGLAKHQPQHCDAQGRKAFSCKYCDKEYVSLGALKMHIRTHTLPCVCKICGKAFSRPWLLQGHIRTHTGEKPFSCPHCSRAFADRSNLRAHLQTHSDVKKYQCKNCSKTFSRMSLLHKHGESGCCAAH